MLSNIYWIADIGFALVLLIVLADSFKGFFGKNSDRSFQVLTCWIIAFCLQDVLWGLCDSGVIKNDAVFFASSTIFHAATVLTTYCWLKFILTYLGDRARHKRLSIIVGRILVLIQFFLLIINFYVPTIFSIYNGVYITYPLRLFAFANQYIIYLMIGLMALFNAHRASKEDKRPFFNVFMFAAAPIFFGVFQYIFPNGPFYSMGYFFGCFIAYVFFINRHVAESKIREDSIRTKTNRLIAVTVIFITTILMGISMIMVNAYSKTVSNNMMIDSLRSQLLRLNSIQRSVEQAVDSIHEISRYAFDDYSKIDSKEDLETYLNLLSSSAVSIANNTEGANAVYFRLNPDIVDNDGRQGFLYLREGRDGDFKQEENTDILAYDPEDTEHVGWYYIPLERKVGTWLPPYYNANLGFDMVSYVLPIYDGDIPIGVIGIDVDFESILKVVEDVDIYESCQSNIVDAGNNTVYYNQCDLLGDRLSDEICSKLSEKEESTVMIPLVINGESYNMHFSTLHNGMKLILYAKKSDMYKIELTLIIVGTIVFVTLFLITLLIAMGFANKITTPIEKINEATKEYAKGNWDVSLDVKTGDELEELTENINYMAMRTKESIGNLNDALIVAKEASNAKSTFLSNVSHDIRTPMNAIVSYSQFAIAQPELSEKTHGYLEHILQASRHLLALLNSVLEMSRIESGKIQIDLIPCNIRELVEELSNLVYANVTEKNQILHIDSSGIIHENVMCDTLRFNQVMINLVGNAVKFTEPGGEIFVTATEDVSNNAKGAVYHFSVRDTGIGIDEKFIDRLFLPFERESDSTVNKIQGTGLGLAISKNFVEMMGGSISVKSKKGEGTEFFIDIKLSFADETNDEEDAKATGLERNETPMEAVDFSALKVLLVEDNKVNRLIAKELLGKKVSLMDEAENGKIALDILASHEPDYYSIILMDVQMPEMNGYEATKVIRAMEDEHFKNIPIIAMTANAFEEDKRNAINAGMNAHIAKPIDATVLFKTMAKLVSD